MGNLNLDKRYTWEPDDYKVSEIMQSYFVNFIRTATRTAPGCPNGRYIDPRPISCGCGSM